MIAIEGYAEREAQTLPGADGVDGSAPFEIGFGGAVGAVGWLVLEIDKSGAFDLPFGLLVEFEQKLGAGGVGQTPDVRDNAYFVTVRKQ